MQFEGIYVPIITPFKDDFSIDWDGFGEVIDFQVKNGTHGIIVGGSTGEFFSLSDEERVTQLEFAVKRAAGRTPVIAGVNDLLVDRCYSQKELVAHCLKIDRIANLPIILYNYPGRTGVSMDEEFLDRVAQSSNFCAIKESAGDIDRVHMLAREYPQLQLSAGAEDLVLEFYAWGARSWVSVVANFFPHEAVRFHEICVLDGDFVTGRKIMTALLPIMNCLEKGGKFLQSVKYACELMDRPAGPVRPPMQPMKKELQREVFQIIHTARRTLRALLDEKE
jgi:4-hydroxy-tetrahydrodipicolinate synthase